MHIYELYKISEYRPTCTCLDKCNPTYVPAHQQYSSTVEYMYVYLDGDPTAIPVICFNMHNYRKVGPITGGVIALCGVMSIPGPVWIHPFVLPMAQAPTRDNWRNCGRISKTTYLVHLQTIQNGNSKF